MPQCQYSSVQDSIFSIVQDFQAFQAVRYIVCSRFRVLRDTNLNNYNTSHELLHSWASSNLEFSLITCYFFLSLKQLIFWSFLTYSDWPGMNTFWCNFFWINLKLDTIQKRIHLVNIYWWFNLILIELIVNFLTKTILFLWQLFWKYLDLSLLLW